MLLHLAGGSLIGLLILSAIANIVLGLGLPTIACYIVLATLVAPTLVQMGIDPMAAHMFILYYGCLSMISPPVAIAAFVAANLAGADHNRTGWTAMAFGWTLFVVPFLFVYSPSLLLKGDPVTIAVDFVAAVAGVWLVAAAVMGYSVRPLALAGARLLRGDRDLHLPAGRNARDRTLDQPRRSRHGGRPVRVGMGPSCRTRPEAVRRARRHARRPPRSRCRATRARRSSAWAFTAPSRARD